jgi:hypothetical protein
METTEKERISQYLNELMDCLGKDKIDFVIKELKTINLPIHYKQQAFQISSRHYNLKNKMIAGVLDDKTSSIERGKIIDSILELINIIGEDSSLGIVCFFDDDNYDTQIASTIFQISNDVYKEVTNNPSNQNEDFKSKFIEIRNCIENMIIEIKNNIYRGPAWGELTAVIENIDIVLKGKVDEKIVDNLIKTLQRVKIPTRGTRISYLDNLVNKDLIMSYKASLGYIDGLLKVLK